MNKFGKHIELLFSFLILYNFITVLNKWINIIKEKAY